MVHVCGGVRVLGLIMRFKLQLPMLPFVKNWALCKLQEMK